VFRLTVGLEVTYNAGSHPKDKDEALYQCMLNGHVVAKWLLC